MTVRQLMLHLRALHPGLYSTERVGNPTPVSSSEVNRWIKIGSVEINHEIVRDPDEVVDYPVMSVVVHPRSTGFDTKTGRKKVHRNTLLYRYGRTASESTYA